MRGGDDLWAKAAELERQFEGYKRRLAERKDSAAAAAAAAAVADRPDVDAGDGCADGEEEVAVVVGRGRGRKYDAYVRRRDEKLRQGWRARMERKEAEMKALWARLDRLRDGDLDHAAGNDTEQKPANLEVKPSISSAPRSSSVMKASLSRPRTPRTSTPSPAGAAASPRLSSTSDARRPAMHREPLQAEPPSTPRKENRVPSTAAAAATTPRLSALLRSRSSLKEYSDRSSSVRNSPRRAPPPRFQSPRPSHDSGGGDRLKPAPVLAPTTGDAIAPPVSQSCQNRPFVLAEIKTASAFRLRRSGNGAGQGQPAASPRPVITRQVDGRRRPSDIGKTVNAQMISTNSDIKSNNFSIDEGISEDDDNAQSSVELGSLNITGDSDTEPSYIYIKKDSEKEAINTSQSQALTASGSNAEEPEAPPEPRSEKETGDLEETAMARSDATARESPVTDQEDASPQSSDQSFYSNVDSSFSHRSELAASATDPPSSTGPSTEQLLEADAAMLRKKREEEEEEEDDSAAGEIKSLLIPSTTTSSSSVAVHVQSPMEAVAGPKRFLTFGKKNVNVKAGDEAAVGEAPPADDDNVGQGRPPSGDSGVRPRICSSDAASDDSDNNYVIPAHVRSLQSCVPCSPAKPVLLKELISSAKSPRAHRSFFSFSSFKSRGY